MILSIYRAKHRRLPRMLGRYDIFEGLTGKKFCKGREPKGASLAVHSVSKLKYRHSPGQEAETHATYLICYGS